MATRPSQSVCPSPEVGTCQLAPRLGVMSGGGGESRRCHGLHLKVMVPYLSKESRVQSEKKHICSKVDSRHFWVH